LTGTTASRPPLVWSASGTSSRITWPPIVHSTAPSAAMRASCAPLTRIAILAGSDPGATSK
jgi:hypothetical protein